MQRSMELVNHDWCALFVVKNLFCSVYL